MKKCPKSSVRPNPSQNMPRIHSTAYIDPSAQVIGNVQIGPRVYVGPNAVIRSDEIDTTGKVQSIVIGPECNVQDGVIIHSLAGKEVKIGTRVSLAHGCVVHGPCSISDGCFVGFRAVIFDATLGRESYVGTGAIVEGVELSPATLVLARSLINSQETVAGLPKVGPAERLFMEKVVATNLKLAKQYLSLESAMGK